MSPEQAAPLIAAGLVEDVGEASAPEPPLSTAPAGRGRGGLTSTDADALRARLDELERRLKELA